MIRSALIAGLCGLLAARCAAGPGKNWLCVGSPEFLESAGPLIKHRRAGGYQVMLAHPPVDQAIANCPGRPDFVVLLGDDAGGEPGGVPWRLQAAQRVYHGWGSWFPATFASDMAWGDLDADGIPDIPVGRLPARSAGQLETMVAKILRWESRSASLADLTLPVWAGDPGFAPVFRDMALGFLIDQVKRRAPLWAELWLMQGDERSPFCGWPATQPADYNRRLGEGGVLSAMIGHGRRQSWWSMDLDGARLEYSIDSVKQITGAGPTPPHVIFACSCGNFALRQDDCLAEALLHAPSGPVLCVAASEDSHPLTNYYHSTAMLECLAESGGTFGGLWLKSLRKAHGTVEQDKELLVRALQPLMIGRGPAVHDIRRDHVFLYNIFGDPATRLFAPAILEAEIREENGNWHWRVTHPEPGARLLVQRRPPVAEILLENRSASPEDAGRRLQEANAALKFITLREMNPGETWEGVSSGPGVLRLVSIGPRGVAVLAAGQNPTALKGKPDAGK